MTGPMVSNYFVTTSIGKLADNTADNHGYLRETGIKRLEPRKAFLRALFPGFLFHGAGHQYAGQPGNGFLLLTTEIVSVPLIIFSLAESWEQKPENDNIWDYYTNSFYGFFGLNLFFGSWAYDMIAAPIKARNYNEKHGLILRLKPTEEGGKLLCIFSF